MTPPMTETRDAVARAICASDFDGDETVFDQMIEGQQQNFRHNADAALACLKPGSRFTVDGVECVVVRKDALDWLNGEGDSFERPDNVRGNFWWRGEFRRRAMLRACEEKS